MKNLKKHWLLLLPMMFFMTGAYFHQANGLYSVKGADPEYIYLANGLSVANGRFDLGNIDNPGIPMDYLVALSFRITHLIRTTDTPFNQDVLANPDTYLRVANLFIIVLLMLVIYFAGYYTLKLTNNLWYAFIVQFTPFATDIIYGNIGRLPTEILIPLPVILLTIVILKIVEERQQSTSRNNLLLLSAISALFLSLKLTLAPLLIIPFFLVNPLKSKIWYVLLTVVMFLIFALPVTLHLDYFFNWIKSLFLYSGNYGQGEKNVIKVDEFLPNIIELYKLNKPFFILTLILSITFIISFFRSKGKAPDRNMKVISITVLGAILLMVLALGKNFRTPYFIPALMLLPLVVIMTIRLINIWIPGKIKKMVSAIYVLMVIFVVLQSHVPIVKSLTVHYGTHNEQRMKAHHFFKLVDKEDIKIIVPGYAGAPIPEFALMTSYQWSGKQRSLYHPDLAKLYPNSYILYAWDKTLNFWGDSLRKEDFARPVYFYFDRAAQKEELAETISEIIPQEASWEKVFENGETTEVIYRLALPQTADSTLVPE